MNLDKFTWYGFWIGVFMAFVSMFSVGVLGRLGIIFECLFLLFSIACLQIGTRDIRNLKKKGK